MSKRLQLHTCVTVWAVFDDDGKFLYFDTPPTEDENPWAFSDDQAAFDPEPESGDWFNDSWLSWEQVDEDAWDAFSQAIKEAFK